MHRNILGAALALAFASTAAHSQGAYVELAVGVSKADVDCDGDSCDKTGTAAKFVGGYQFANEFAAEVSYFSLGKARDRTFDVDFSGSYLGLGGAWLPSFGNNWGGVARGGVAFVTGKLESQGVSFSHDSTQPYFGLGVTYAFSKQLKAELDFDTTKVEHAIADVKTTSTVNSLTLGASYAF
jgi:hypothetical protein